MKHSTTQWSHDASERGYVLSGSVLQTKKRLLCPCLVRAMLLKSHMAKRYKISFWQYCFRLRFAAVGDRPEDLDARPLQTTETTKDYLSQRKEDLDPWLLQASKLHLKRRLYHHLRKASTWSSLLALYRLETGSGPLDRLQCRKIEPAWHQDTSPKPHVVILDMNCHLLALNNWLQRRCGVPVTNFFEGSLGRVRPCAY